ncbi:MAG: WD40/YVTN/BNR-like repeat-containing protein [Fimbriiglobus sp.]
MPWLLAAMLCLLPQDVPAPREVKPDATAKKDVEKKKDEGYPLGAFKLRSVGPSVTSGRIVGLAVHPKDINTYYVAVACGGVWKTTNNGVTWTPIFDEQGSFSIGYVTLDPNNPETVWVGSGENNSQRSVAYGDGVYKSTDGGKSWKNMGLKDSQHIGKVQVDAKDSQIVTVAAQGPLWNSGGDRGLYRTNNGGEAWTKLLNIDDDTGITDFIISPTSPKTIIAASYQRRRHVWTLVNGGPGSGIHRTDDDGKTWKKLGNGLPSGDLGRIGLAIAPSDPNTLYAIIETAGIYRSTDGGQNWVKQNPYDQQAQYYSHIVVDPSNKDRIYVMNVYIQVSDDGGKTLRPLGEKFKHVDNHCIWINPANPKHYRVGCDGGVYESYDRAANWDFKANLPVTQFYDVGVDQNPASGPFYHIYGGTQDNYTLGGPVRTRSQHGIMNSDWYVVQGGDGFHCTVDPTDSNTVYGEYQYGGLCRFDRKTGNRVEIQPLAAPGEPPLRWNWDSPMILSPHNPKRVYFAANKLFRSDDRGDTWKPISPDLTRQLDRDRLKVFGKIQPPEAVSKHVSTSIYGNIVALAESPKSEGRIYIGTDDGLIQITSNGGETWTKTETFPGIPDRTYVSKLVASQHDAKVVYAAFDNHKMGDFKPYLLKSEDGGLTWKSLAATLPERGTVYSLAEDHKDPKLLFLGTEFGLYFTRDGGQSWHRMKGGLPTIMVKDLVIQRANDDLIVGTFGRGFYVLDDYSPLRNLTKESTQATVEAPASTMLYIPNAQFGGRGKAFLGQSLYTAENSPYGITFTLRHNEKFQSLKEKRKLAQDAAAKDKKDIDYPKLEDLRAEAEEETPTLALVIKDGSGETIRMVAVPTEAGVHRVTWDLRERGINTTSDLAGNGFLSLPGDYFATLVKRYKGQFTTLAPAVKVRITPDTLSGAKTEDYAAMREFQKQVKKLNRDLRATLTVHGELTPKFDAIKVALDNAPNAADADRVAVRGHVSALKVMARRINGDSFLAARNENTPTALSARLNVAESANEDSLYAPTGTQRQALAQSAKLLAEEIAILKKLQTEELPKLEKRLETMGLPLSNKLP